MRSFINTTTAMLAHSDLEYSANVAGMVDLRRRGPQVQHLYPADAHQEMCLGLRCAKRSCRPASLDAHCRPSSHHADRTACWRTSRLFGPGHLTTIG
jgi:hypothetical protein